MTGPMMTSKESYAEMRNELISYIEDQAINGVYKTIPKEVKIQDLMTGAEKTVMRVEIAKDASGAPLRQEASPLTRFGVKIYNLSINSIDYDDNVEKQISAQQQAIMEVQTAMAEAKKAEQRALTAAKEGEANAAKAKWEQETIKARAVTEAQQKLEVAELDKKAAEQTKQKEILLGEGEARRKELAMQAEGALEQKLKAYIEVNKVYADAISKYTGAWVPTIVMGSGASGKSGSGAQDLIDLLMVKTAKDLSLDLSVPGTTKK
jgi:regulator of protease activity HflC (stomatin/prohibitin superfamily)